MDRVFISSTNLFAFAIFWMLDIRLGECSEDFVSCKTDFLKSTLWPNYVLKRHVQCLIYPRQLSMLRNEAKERP